MHSTALGDPAQMPFSISGILASFRKARSKTEDKSRGGNRALNLFSADLKGVHS